MLNTKTPSNSNNNFKNTGSSNEPSKPNGSLFGQTGNIFGSPISRSLGSEVFNELKTALTEIYKSASSNVEIAILDMDNQSDTIFYSCLVVAMRLKELQNYVAYHILILEATGGKIPALPQHQGHKQIEIFRPPSDAVSEVLISKVKTLVKRAFPDATCIYTEATCVPETFNAKDKNAVHQLALNTGLANGTELNIKLPTFSDLNLKQLPTNNNLVVNMTFGDNMSSDAVGSLMRSDFQLNFVSQNNQIPNVARELNSGAKETQISDSNGFIEMLWAPLEPTASVYAPIAQRQPQKFAARAVITNLTSVHSYTPGNMLLTLAMMDALAMNNNYYQALRPRMTKDVDLKDIGALNIEGNFDNNPQGFSSALDTKSSSFTTEQMGVFLNTLVRPGLMVALDCPMSGANTWYTGLFSAASENFRTAYDIIYAAAEELTDGNFSKYFPQNGLMFVDTGNKIHLGYYTDKNGAKRDIRDIDYLAAANILGANNLHQLKSFTEATLNTTISLEERLSDKKKMISSLTQETAVFTGYANRVTFHPKFLEAIRNGISATGTAVKINTPMNGSEFNSQRSVAGFAYGGVITQSQTFMGNNNPYNYVGTQMNNGGFRY